MKCEWFTHWDTGTDTRTHYIHVHGAQGKILGHTYRRIIQLTRILTRVAHAHAFQVYPPTHPPAPQPNLTPVLEAVLVNLPSRAPQPTPPGRIPTGTTVQCHVGRSVTIPRVNSPGGWGHHQSLLTVTSPICQGGPV